MSLLDRHISSQGRSVLNFHGACLHFRLGVLGPNPHFKLINSYYILFSYYLKLFCRVVNLYLKAQIRKYKLFLLLLNVLIYVSNRPMVAIVLPERQLIIVII